MIDVSLVRADGTPALTGTYIVDLFDTWQLESNDVFAVHGVQSLPFASRNCVDLDPGALLGTAPAPLLTAKLGSLGLLETLQHEFVAPVAPAASPSAPATAARPSTTPASLRPRSSATEDQAPPSTPSASPLSS